VPRVIGISEGIQDSGVDDDGHQSARPGFNFVLGKPIRRVRFCVALRARGPATAS
jgi:hypothetical protein